MKFEPLESTAFLSKIKEEWLRTDINPGYSRMTALVEVLITTRRPSRSTQSIFDALLKNNKLHDGEPALVVKTLEARHPNFFFMFPCTGALTENKKQAFIGEWSKAYLRRGKPAYGKPKLRKTRGDLVESTHE